MGCGESKDVQQISVSAAQKKLEDSLKDLDVVRLSSASSSSGLGSTGSGSAPNSPGDDEASLFHQESVDSLGALPTTLDNIPNSDLGVSAALWLSAEEAKFWSYFGVSQKLCCSLIQMRFDTFNKSLIAFDSVLDQVLVPCHGRAFW